MIPDRLKLLRVDVMLKKIDEPQIEAESSSLKSLLISGLSATSIGMSIASRRNGVLKPHIRAESVQ
jgi:hypothetical protein